MANCYEVTATITILADNPADAAEQLWQRATEPMSTLVVVTGDGAVNTLERQPNGAWETRFTDFKI